MNLRVVMRVISLLSAFSPLLAEEASAPTPTNEPNAYVLKGPYKTEQEWIVGSICRNALELLSFIVDKKGEIVSPDHVSVTKINANQVAYHVSVHANRVTLNVTLRFPGSIWSSQAYVPFCEAAMNQLKVTAASFSRRPKGNPLGTLVGFSEQSIEAENVRISEWLSEEPDNPFAQEQAALVLGTLAMKENSGWFWDPRDICNHVIAHLTVARSLVSGRDLAVEGMGQSHA